MHKSKKKLLILIDWFYPGYKAGGPIRSCINIILAIRGEFDIYVLTTDTDHNTSDPYGDVVSNEWSYSEHVGAYVYYARKSTLTLRQLFKEIDYVQADILYLNHLFSPRFVVYPIWLKKVGKIKGELIVCPRGALARSALSHKLYKKIPLLVLYRLSKLKNLVSFHATNKKEQMEIENYFPGSNIIIADNLPNLNQKRFQSLPKEEGFLKCVFIARIVEIKNLLFVLKVLADVQSSVEFSIVGPIEDVKYWAVCKLHIGKLPENIKVNYIGARSNEELPAILEQHHLFVLPTQGENFGHSIFESFIAGRPVLISNQTPWLHLNEKKAGWDLSLNEPNAFKEVIEYLAMCNQDQFDEYAIGAWKFACEFISNPNLKDQYIKLFS